MRSLGLLGLKVVANERAHALRVNRKINAWYAVILPFSNTFFLKIPFLLRGEVTLFSSSLLFAESDASLPLEAARLLFFPNDLCLLIIMLEHEVLGENCAIFVRAIGI